MFFGSIREVLVGSVNDRSPCLVNMAVQLTDGSTTSNLASLLCKDVDLQLLATILPEKL